ncbi:MAG: ABC transporter ATP-binding protein [Rhodospirillaceae bacterium]|jgi:spermidine/putrescine transport system ATP-binding protein/putrescine transport system ATP-binding protein|nr:ABC transporter ATP-binding protein [Rhodospirillaceae bacterium]
MTRSLLEIQGITKRFGPVTAVDKLSLTVNDGEFFAILGPSGCGKTTLLRVVAGFETPDEGRVVLAGADITELKANRRPVNLMFQSYALFPHMSVAGNVAYGLEMEGVRGAELGRRVDEALALVRMSDYARRKPGQLSGGQKQRVALARALVKRPKVLLLDEPLGALDRKLREQMQIELKKLQQDSGIAFVVVTHDQEEALTLADRIALLDRGRIVQLDTPRALYDRPASRFAADFIGLMNFVEGTANGTGFTVKNIGTLPAPAGSGSLLAIRPERVRLSDQAESGAIAGQIEGAAFLGQDVIAHVAVPGLERPIIARLAAGHALAARLARGQNVWLSWQADQAVLLQD